MLLSNALGDEVLSRLKGEALPPEITRGGFEEWLSRLADDQPDLFEYENLRRRAYFSIIARWIAYVIEDCERGVPDRVGWPQGWLRRFLGVAHAARATIITFNYDSLVERAVNRSFLYDEFGQIRSSDTLDDLPPRLDGVRSEPRSTFRMLKVHGSTRFYWLPNDNSGASIVRWPQPEDNPETPGSDQGDPRQQRLLRGREPLIVPPTSLKSRYYDVPFLRGLWQEARDAISKATHLYLVGYSLPTTDLVTIGLLREIVRRDCQIVIVNEGPGLSEVKDRCEQLVGRPTGANVSEGIEVDAWVNEIVDLRARDGANVITHDLANVASGARGKAADTLVHVTVTRADKETREVAESCEDQGINLSFQEGRPLDNEPRCTLASVATFAERSVKQHGKITCNYSDGGKGVILEGWLRQPPRSAEYSLRLASVAAC